MFFSSNLLPVTIFFEMFGTSDAVFLIISKDLIILIYQPTKCIMYMSAMNGAWNVFLYIYIHIFFTIYTRCFFFCFPVSVFSFHCPPVLVVSISPVWTLDTE